MKDYKKIKVSYEIIDSTDEVSDLIFLELEDKKATFYLRGTPDPKQYDEIKVPGGNYQETLEFLDFFFETDLKEEAVKMALDFYEGIGRPEDQESSAREAVDQGEFINDLIYDDLQKIIDKLNIEELIK